MYNSNQKNRGYLYIILGGVILFLFAGQFLFPLAAITLSFLLINHGLGLLGQPSLLIVLQRWLDEIRYRFRS